MNDLTRQSAVTLAILFISVGPFAAACAGEAEDGEVSQTQVAAWIEQGTAPLLLDVRTPEEWETAKMEGAELLDYNDSGRYMDLPKDRKMVFACKTGDRSLDVAAYFKGHGFSEVYSMRGGVESWREQVDPSISNA